MASLISPEYDLAEFCKRMFGKNPVEVMEAASAEITYARQSHRKKTKDRDFRKGSRGRAYCEDLRQFISLFMGSFPDTVSPEFVAAVKPLAVHLLQRWEMVGLRELVEKAAQKADTRYMPAAVGDACD